MMELSNYIPLIYILLLIENGFSIILTKTNEQKNVISKHLPLTIDYHQGLSSLNYLEYVPVPYSAQLANSYKSSYLNNIRGSDNDTKKQNDDYIYHDVSDNIKFKVQKSNENNKGIFDAIRDTLGIPKITYKLPFLKGRFALAAKVIQNKNDRQTKPDTINTNINEITPMNENASFSKTSAKISDANELLTTSFQKQIKSNYPIAMWCEDVQQSQNRYNYRLFYETDKCCMKHNTECSMVIPSGMMWNNLKNLGIYTRSHCDCDRKFYDCLKEVNTAVSHQIGYTYFNILRPQCFRKDYPIYNCIQWSNNQCTKYIYSNTSMEKIWQWYDNEIY